MSNGYLWLKFGHILGVIVWLGGSFALTVLSALLAGANEPRALRALNRQAAFYGPVVIGSSSMLVLLTGLVIGQAVEQTGLQPLTGGRIGHGD